MLGRAGSGSRAGGVHHHRRGRRLGVARTSVITMAMTPRISRTTPVLLMIAISRIPMMLIAVVMASKMTPSSTAFPGAADRGGRGVPAQELEARPDGRQHGLERDGPPPPRLRTCPMIMTQAGEPAERLPGQPRRPLEDRARDRETAPRGWRSSAPTSIWPANTIGQVQKNAAPAEGRSRGRTTGRRW